MKIMQGGIAVAVPHMKQFDLVIVIDPVSKPVSKSKLIHKPFRDIIPQRDEEFNNWVDVTSSADSVEAKMAKAIPKQIATKANRNFVFMGPCESFRSF